MICLLKQFITVFAMNTPIKVESENDVVLYGQWYKGADRDNSFDVFSIDELLDKYGDYIVEYSFICDGVLYIDIEKRS